MRRISLFMLSLLLPGCYTVKQGYHQVRLLAKRTPIEEVIKTHSESVERLAKLQEVPKLIAFAVDELGLTPGKSYRTYVALDESAVTWVVEAAEKRRLKRKTWWFPIVGEQPYLGYFRRKDAEAFRDQLRTEGYDTKLGGVQAFSMLGYIADPVYSSMLDGNSLPELVEVLLHEMVHATIYLPGFPVFNENLATFFSVQGTQAYFRKFPRVDVDAVQLMRDYERNLVAQAKFQDFLKSAKAELEQFYERAATDRSLDNDAAFQDVRERIFGGLADRFKQQMNGAEKATMYEFAFSKGRINNAVVLGYSLYEARQEPFAELLAAVNGDLRRFLQSLQRCMESGPKTEEELWSRLHVCREELK